MSRTKCNQTKCHTEKMSQDIMSQDIMSQEIMSQGKIVTRTKCHGQNVTGNKRAKVDPPLVERVERVGE